MALPGFFKGTEMPTAGWWEALWPNPAMVANEHNNVSLQNRSNEISRPTFRQIGTSEFRAGNNEPVT